MKILSLINVSNPDDLMCDSGAIFQKILIEKFCQKDIEYHIIGPHLESFKSFDFGEHVTKHYAHIGTTRYSSRFGFDWDNIKNTVLSVQPDIIFNCQVEVASALRGLLITLGLSEVKIVTYCHYPALWPSDNDTPLLDQSLNHQNMGTPVLFNILSALHTSDAFVIQSDFAKNLVEDAARFHRVSFNEIHTIAPPADPRLLAKDRVDTPPTNKILYNHRLYETYGTAEFLDFIDTAIPPQATLLVSDPMPSRSDERRKLSPTPLKYRSKIAQLPYAELFQGNVPRQEYRSILSDVRLAFGAFRKACVWSMAAMDCMGLGIPVIAPRYAAYPELIPNPLLFSSLEEAETIMMRLLNDDTFWMECSQQCHQIAWSFSPQNIANQFYNLFSQVSSSAPNPSCVV